MKYSASVLIGGTLCKVKRFVNIFYFTTWFFTAFFQPDFRFMNSTASQQEIWDFLCFVLLLPLFLFRFSNKFFFTREMFFSFSLPYFCYCFGQDFQELLFTIDETTFPCPTKGSGRLVYSNHFKTSLSFLGWFKISSSANTLRLQVKQALEGCINFRGVSTRLVNFVSWGWSNNCNRATNDLNNDQ